LPGAGEGARMLEHQRMVVVTALILGTAGFAAPAFLRPRPDTGLTRAAAGGDVKALLGLLARGRTRTAPTATV